MADIPEAVERGWVKCSPCFHPNVLTLKSGPQKFCCGKAGSACLWAVGQALASHRANGTKGLAGGRDELPAHRQARPLPPGWCLWWPRTGYSMGDPQNQRDLLLGEGSSQPAPAPYFPCQPQAVPSPPPPQGVRWNEVGPTWQSCAEPKLSKKELSVEVF